MSRALGLAALVSAAACFSEPPGVTSSSGSTTGEASTTATTEGTTDVEDESSSGAFTSTSGTLFTTGFTGSAGSTGPACESAPPLPLAETLCSNGEWASELSGMKPEPITCGTEPRPTPSVHRPMGLPELLFAPDPTMGGVLRGAMDLDAGEFCQPELLLNFVCAGDGCGGEWELLAFSSGRVVMNYGGVVPDVESLEVIPLDEFVDEIQISVQWLPGAPLEVRLIDPAIVDG